MKLKTILLGALTMFAMTAPAQKIFDVNLYQGKAPNSNGDDSETARVWVFLPSEREATGRAIVICPGGAYEHLALNHEGYDWGEYFMNNGIAAIVLKYRMPHGEPDVPITDAETALRLVRRNAQGWGIKTNDVGIMGFSAGGHLASYVATHGKGETRPDFQILFYPVITMMDGYSHEATRTNLLGKRVSKRQERKYSTDMHVSRTTPRAYIALSDDDDAVPPANGVHYYVELYRNDVRGSLHVYPSGGHGWGAKMGFKHHLEMQMNLMAWLKSF